MRRTIASLTAGLVGLLVFIVPQTAAQAIACPSVGSISTPFNLAADGTNTMDESSGVIASTDYQNSIWDHEDGGTTVGPHKVYAHNVNTGALKAVITLSGVVNTDWEDITLKRQTGTDVVIVADTGDMNHNRTDSSLIAFNEPNPANGNATVTPTVYPITFWNGSTQVFPNVEAVAIDQAVTSPHIFLFAKENSGGGRLDFSVFDAGAYSSLSTSGNQATTLASIGGVSQTKWTSGTRIGPVAADISPNRNYLVIKNYVEALVWPRNGAGWSATFAADNDSPCTPLDTGSGKFEGLSFADTNDALYQVRDDMNNGNSPFRTQPFIP